MKLFVWENVLTDYTDGLVCVLAHNETEAWERMKATDKTAWLVLRGQPEDREDPREPHELDESATRPRCVEAPEAFICWGGG